MPKTGGDALSVAEREPHSPDLPVAGEARRGCSLTAIGVIFAVSVLVAWGLLLIGKAGLWEDLAGRFDLGNGVPFLQQGPGPTETATLTPPPTPTRTLPQLIQDLSPSIVKVIAGDGGGTGFVVFRQGYVLTAYHVLGSTKTPVTVYNSINNAYAATLLGADEEKDLALLSVPGLAAPPLALASSIPVGEQVMAIGYAALMEGSPTVTRGIVSARRTDAETGVVYLQTDAPINPGNSGGPLLNEHGEVVGVNDWVLRGSGQYENMGFAISVEVIEQLLPALRSGTVKLIPSPTPRPTRTPLPTSTPLAGRVPLPTPSISPLRVTKGVLELSSDDPATGSVNGAYVVSANRSNLMNARFPAQSIGSDIVLSVDAIPLGDASTGTYGVIFRRRPDSLDYFYEFEISPQGSFRVVKMYDGEWINLVDWTRSNAIVKGNSLNTVGIVAKKSTFNFFVNDVLVAEARDISLGDGAIGLCANTYESDAFSVKFDTLRVWEAR